MMQRRVWSAALAACVALAACGGSDSEDPPEQPAPTPTGDRIEPLDTATLPRSTPLKMQAASSRLPAGAVAARVALGPLPAAPKSTATDKGAALRIGEARAIEATAGSRDLARLLRWSALPDGSRVAAVVFAADGAQAIRLGVLAQQLPAGAVLRFYGAPGSDVVEVTAAELAALRQTNQAGGLAGDAARMVWGPDTAGALSTLEIQLPPGVDANRLQLAVPQLSHLTQTAAQAVEHAKDLAQVGNAGRCNLDVQCTPDLDGESRSVAKMVFSKGGSTYLCTGTLLNDTADSQTPFFLTAAHCIADQEAASSLITYWFFRAASCDSAPNFDEQAVRLFGGARLLFSHAHLDTTLLQLNTSPPANVVYAGSYFGAGAVPGVGLAGVHHPAGDLQKYSLGEIVGYANCAIGGSSCSRTGAEAGAMFEVTWQRGTTEGGSSGSAIFARSGDRRYVVGALHGGSASCQNPGGSDFYGRFERAFTAGVRNWLVR
jgi:hypothetical protein